MNTDIMLRDRVIEIMTETLWQRLLNKIITIENEHQIRRHVEYLLNLQKVPFVLYNIQNHSKNVYHV